MDGWVGGWMRGRKDAMDGRIGWIDGCVDEQMNRGTDERMDG